MPITCQGCKVHVDVEPCSGLLRTQEGETGTALFADGQLVVWECPCCEYPNADTF